MAGGSSPPVFRRFAWSNVAWRGRCGHILPHRHRPNIIIRLLVTRYTVQVTRLVFLGGEKYPLLGRTPRLAWSFTQGDSHAYRFSGRLGHHDPRHAGPGDVRAAQKGTA